MIEYSGGPQRVVDCYLPCEPSVSSVGRVGLVPEARQLAADLPATPVRVVAGQLQHEPADRRGQCAAVMKVFVVGATGWLGCPTVNKLLAAGHEVPGLARSGESGGRLERQGARAARASLFELAALRHAIAGHDAVVNLAARSSRSI
jgi:hypothetical protein